MFDVHIYRKEYSARPGLPPCETYLTHPCPTRHDALQYAHSVALQDSRDAMGDKSNIPFNTDGYYNLPTFWGFVCIQVAFTKSK